MIAPIYSECTSLHHDIAFVCLRPALPCSCAPLPTRGGRAIEKESETYGLVAIDNLTKVANVIPIQNRQPAELIRGLKLIFESMGTPKQIYSDEEGGFRATTFFRFMNEAKIKHIQTSTHAHTVERFIITHLNNLYRRLDVSSQ